MNELKHGIRFEDAIKVFADPYHLIDQDREVDGEARWQLIGMVDDVRILLVAYTVVDESEGELARIISARRADRKERTRYAQVG